MKLAKATVDELKEIHQQRPMPELVQHLVDGIDRLVQRHALFVASSCGGSKESYIPPLPPLTRCNQDSRLLHQLLLNLNCGVGTEAAVVTATRVQQRVVRPTTSSASTCVSTPSTTCLASCTPSTGPSPHVGSGTSSAIAVLGAPPLTTPTQQWTPQLST